MTYQFNTPDQQAEMLAAIGVASMAELLEQVPAAVQLDRPLNLPPALTEVELQRHVAQLAGRNANTRDRLCLMGGGAYDHFIPAVVDEIVSRGELYTAYTPYQAEASQGSLQLFFEYQSLICQLTGMDVSNASLYEGATAVSEAVFMAMRVTNRHGKVVMLGSVHPESIQVVRTYLETLETELVVVPAVDGKVDPQAVAAAVDDNTCAVVIQQPNFFGSLEDAAELVKQTHAAGALAIVSCDPISLGVLQRPGDYGADITVAEGQPLGVPLQYGGPYLGILACGQKFMRKMPGRLIGKTVDRNGKPCFVLNLQAREQHIRRDKATSNICTNQGLLALRATVYLATLGPQGLREVAELCCHRAHYAAEQLCQLDGIEMANSQPFFKEFAIKTKLPAAELIEHVAAAGIDIGPALSRFPETAAHTDIDAKHTLLIAVTEKHTKADIDALVAAVKSSA